MHTRYIKNQEWCDYSPSYDSSWCWKKIWSIKDYFNDGWLKSKSLDWKNLTQCKVSSGYSWQQENHGKVNWDKIFWCVQSLPGMLSLLRSISRTDYQLSSDLAGFNLRGTSQASSIISSSLLKLKTEKLHRLITYAVFSTSVYFI